MITTPFYTEQKAYEELTRHQKIWSDPNLIRSEWLKKPTYALKIEQILDTNQVVHSITEWANKPLFDNFWKLYFLKGIVVIATLTCAVVLVVNLFLFSFFFIKYFVATARFIYLLKYLVYLLTCKVYLHIKYKQALTIKHDLYLQRFWKNLEIKYKFSKIRCINWKWKHEWVDLNLIKENPNLDLLHVWQISAGRGFFQIVEIYFLDLVVYWYMSLIN